MLFPSTLHTAFLTRMAYDIHTMTVLQNSINVGLAQSLWTCFVTPGSSLLSAYNVERVYQYVIVSIELFYIHSATV
jgi:hypothetical protein